MAVCLNHPDVLATHRCKTCAKPLCDKCTLETDFGVFCSEDCKAQGRKFKEKYPDGVPAKKRGCLLKTLMHWVIFLATVTVVCLLLYLVIVYGLGTSERAPEFMQDMSERGKEFFGNLF